MHYRNMSAIDLIVGKANLDVEESEIDTHLSTNFQSAENSRLNIKRFFDNVTIQKK